MSNSYKVINATPHSYNLERKVAFTFRKSHFRNSLQNLFSKQVDLEKDRIIIYNSIKTANLINKTPEFVMKKIDDFREEIKKLGNTDNNSQAVKYVEKAKNILQEINPFIQSEKDLIQFSNSSLDLKIFSTEFYKKSHTLKEIINIKKNLEEIERKCTEFYSNFRSFTGKENSEVSFDLNGIRKYREKNKLRLNQTSILQFAELKTPPGVENIPSNYDKINAYNENIRELSFLYSVNRQIPREKKMLKKHVKSFVKKYKHKVNMYKGKPIQLVKPRLKNNYNRFPSVHFGVEISDENLD